MTKIHRQPKQPKPARVTLAECRRLAEKLGLGPIRVIHSKAHGWYTDAPDWTGYKSRSVMMRVLHAALEAMLKEQGK